MTDGWAQRLGFTVDEVAELLAAGGLPDRAAAKLAEVEAKVADLAVVRETLRDAVDAGCADPVACAHAPSCPIPFAGW